MKRTCLIILSTLMFSACDANPTNKLHTYTDDIPDAGANASPICGNGIREGLELCDGPDIPVTCVGAGYLGGEIGCSPDCMGIDVTNCQKCGNNIIDPEEQCDGSNLSGLTCLSLGFEGGVLYCWYCKLSTDHCIKPRPEPGEELPGQSCGDQKREGSEECDGPDIPHTCRELGYDGGDVLCTNDCKEDFSDCSLCGNGKLEHLYTYESCDGQDLGNATCQQLGFVGGELSCTPGCQLDTSKCHKCGNGLRDNNEQCDGNDLGGANCRTAAPIMPIVGYDFSSPEFVGDLAFLESPGKLKCNSSCKFDTSSCCLNCQVSECGPDRCGGSCGYCGPLFNCVFDGMLTYRCKKH